MATIKRILQIMPEFGLAGAETMCETLVSKLNEDSSYILYIASLFDFHSPITERLEKKGIKIFYIGKQPGFDFCTIIKLYRIMKENKIDIIHTHRYVMQYAIPAAVLARVPVRIHTVHNMATKEVDIVRRKLAYLFYNFCNVTPVSISPIISDTISLEYRIAKENIPMVYNGTDLSKCDIKKSYESDEQFRFIHIGRMSYQKNHELILFVAERLKDEGFSFVIDLIGSGENEHALRLLVNELGLVDYVNFCGLQDNVFPFLKKSDCFILPSRYEGMPVTIVEAMGCAMPIIASAVGGVPDMIINGESGIIIEPNEENLYSAMVEMMKKTPEERKYLGENALKRSFLFSAENMCRGYIGVYERELSKCRK